MKYTEIQKEVIAKYRVIINTHSTCWGRTHAHVKERKVCKWAPKNSINNTFTLLHEIGHIETTKSYMRRSEAEYYATCWAIDKCKEYNVKVPEKILYEYQCYILMEVARGERRHGKRYGEMNIYYHAGIDKSIEQFKKEIDPRWAACISGKF